MGDRGRFGPHSNAASGLGIRPPTRSRTRPCLSAKGALQVWAPVRRELFSPDSYEGTPAEPATLPVLHRAFSNKRPVRFGASPDPAIQPHALCALPLPFSIKKESPSGRRNACGGPVARSIAALHPCGEKSRRGTGFRVVYTSQLFRIIAKKSGEFVRRTHNGTKASRPHENALFACGGRHGACAFAARPGDAARPRAGYAPAPGRRRARRYVRRRARRGPRNLPDDIRRRPLESRYVRYDFRRQNSGRHHLCKHLRR